MATKGDEWGKMGDGGGYMVVMCERILYLVNHLEKKKKKEECTRILFATPDRVFIIYIYIYLISISLYFLILYYFTILIFNVDLPPFYLLVR